MSSEKSDAVVLDLDASSGDETVPLLPKKHTPHVTLPAPSKGKDLDEDCSALDDEDDIFMRGPDGKMLLYDHDSLLTYKTVLHMGSSALVHQPVIQTLVYCSALATLCAVTVFFIPAASRFDTSKFQRLSFFMKVFIAFMIGVYVGDAFRRWWTTVTHFERFLTSIRALIFMLHTVDAAPGFRKTVRDHCVASAYILNVEVHNVQTVDAKRHYSVKAVLDAMAKKGFLREGDVDELSAIQLTPMSILGTTRAVWSWIGESLIECQTDNGAEVHPNMMVRLQVLCQTCVSDLENLKMNIIMQPPFMYAHLLAILVHFNNTLLAVTGGFTLGSALNEINRRHEQMHGDRSTQRDSGDVLQEYIQALQITGVQLLIILVGPILYMAFLHIAHMLCYPFGDRAYHLPTETFIDRLDEELKQMSQQRTWMKEKTRSEQSPRLPVRLFHSGYPNPFCVGLPTSPGYPTGKFSSPKQLVSEQ